MVTLVLDASAVLRFIDDEAGVEIVSDALHEAATGQARVVFSAIHDGEVIGVSDRRGVQVRADRIAARLSALKIEVLPADTVRAAKSAIVHVTRKIPYAESFAVEPETEVSDARLLTADFDFKPLENEISVKFLPPKPKALPPSTGSK